MKKYLYFNYFRSPDPGRREEYFYCVKQNLSKKFIDGYFIFLDDQSHASDIPPDSRVQFVNLGRRMEFRDVFDHAEKTLPPGSVIIVINLDIFLSNDSSWSRIDQDFFSQGYEHKALVCTRHNFRSMPSEGNIDVEIETANWLAGNFCDAWVLSTPLLPKFVQEDFRFCVGNAPQCDNLMMGLMSRHYHTYSWGRKYAIMHLDVCRGVRYQEKLLAYGDNTDHRAAERRLEHRNIPTQQPWQQLLESREKPITIYSWFEYERTR